MRISLMMHIPSALLLTVIAFTQGCISSNGSLSYSDDHNHHVSYLPVGIPFLLGGHGTSVPLTREVSLTAKHVAILDYSKVIAYHPDCDLALIEQDNHDKSLSKLGIIHSEQILITVGRNAFGRTLIGEGRYYRDVYLQGHELFERCPASISDAPVQSGMSGGGVYNANSELVGVISAMAEGIQLADGTVIEAERISLFIPLLYVSEWIIKQVDGYYASSPVLEAENTLELSSAFSIGPQAYK
ncbi:S1C family serine protease [Vibrio renipiscarius]|uniref:S1C family serine protease n=1 Tax=Vibrio renipiscarius TaxID=1461322 RepID=UPI001269BD03|nr:S1C family serine protease [Vibrio renipiscarius]